MITIWSKYHISASSCFPMTHALNNTSTELGSLWIFRELAFQCEDSVKSISFYAMTNGSFHLGIWQVINDTYYTLKSKKEIQSLGHGLQTVSWDEDNMISVISGYVIGIHGTSNGTELPLYFVTEGDIGSGDTVYTTEDLSVTFTLNTNDSQLTVGNNYTVTGTYNRMPSLEVTLNSGRCIVRRWW